MDGQSGGRGVCSQGAQARAHTSRTPRSRRKRHLKNRKRSETYTGLFLTQDFVFVNTVNDRRDDVNST